MMFSRNYLQCFCGVQPSVAPGTGRWPGQVRVGGSLLDTQQRVPPSGLATRGVLSGSQVAAAAVGCRITELQASWEVPASLTLGCSVGI